MPLKFMEIKKSGTVLLFFSLLFFNIDFAQSKFEIFPSELLIQPYTANTLKPKLGFEFKTSVNELNLNIGNSLDIIHFRINDKTKLSAGADLFTYTLLRSQSDFHFPVDAVDYLFGFNFGYRISNENSEIGTRLRISHISTHFVDGHYDKDKNEWRENRDPIVYSREFFELIPYYRFNDFRLYAGLTYIFSIDPSEIGKDQYQIGIEYFANDWISYNITPFIAYDFRLVNIYEYSGNNSLEAGLKYGYSKARGISIFLKYYSGYSQHGEYFDVKEEFISLGFNLDI